MSAYDNDPRVRTVNEYFVVVSAPDDEYCVAARNSPDDWWAGNMLGGTSDRAAECRSREDWTAYRGPAAFDSEGDDVNALIEALLLWDASE